tara:strand:- start:179 stop:1396 length:1218 start_codon:yes stop_codon:yes gene_type:complete
MSWLLTSNRQQFFVGVTLLTLVSSGAPHVINGQEHGRPIRQTIGNGTASIDVFAQGLVLDLLTAERDDGDLTLHHRRSLDGGQTWGAARVIDTSLKPISLASRGNEPQIVAHDEHVVVHWSTKGNARFGAGPMVTAISDDAGKNWRLGSNPVSDDFSGAQNFADMTADEKGTFYVAWIGSHDGPAGRALEVSRSTDFGKNWEQYQIVDTSSCACCWNKMITSGEGQVRVLYRDHGIRDMALASTDNAGESWSLNGTVGEFDWEFEGCPHVGGGIAAVTDAEGHEELHALVWTGHAERHGLYWVKSTNDLSTWSDPRPIGGERARHADLGVNDQTVVATWDEGRGIWISLGRDFGSRWSEPRRISRENYVASHPLIVQTGNISRIFWTERDDAGVTAWQSEAIVIE